jgi:hypothetical protein
MDLPQPQRTALEVAFAIADAPLSGDRFAVGAAVLNVLAAAAVERPILVVVDDIQWIDDPSASALIFAARRLEHDRVGFLLAYRDGEVSELPDLPQLHLEGLDAAATAHLLASRNLKLTTRQVAGLVRLSGGNPLALVELPDLMTGERLAELDFDAGPLPLGTVLETAYAQKIDRLPDSARRALLVAALIHGSDPQALRTALAAAEVDVSALEVAQDARLIFVDTSAPADQIGDGSAGGQLRSTAGTRMDRRCARGRPQRGRSGAAGLASGRDKLRPERGHRHDVGGIGAACGQYVGVRVGVLGVRAGRAAERLRRTSGRPAVVGRDGGIQRRQHQLGRRFAGARARGRRGGR